VSARAWRVFKAILFTLLVVLALVGLPAPMIAARTAPSLTPTRGGDAGDRGYANRSMAVGAAWGAGVRASSV
jgi:hypothetical protein